MSFLTSSKHFQGVADILLRDPVRYLPFAQLLDGMMSTQSDLSQAQREMIALYSSRLNHCGYCVDSHSCVLTGLGTDEYFRQVGGMVSQQGYSPLVQMIQQKADAGRT